MKTDPGRAGQVVLFPGPGVEGNKMIPYLRRENGEDIDS